MLGHPGQAYHLEFTRQRGHQVGRATTQENLLVFYIPDSEQWTWAIRQMRDAGYEPVSSYNPYWEARGRTFEDPDGYRVVLQNAAWSEWRLGRVSKGVAAHPGVGLLRVK